MKRFLKAFSGALVACGLLAVPVLAQAQTLTLRLEPGVAIPLASPQSDRFHVGGAFALKPELGLGSYFSVGPALSIMALPSAVPGVATGTAWTAGAFARVKRPHDDKNKGSGLSAVSPWADADLQYVFTDPLSRFGWAAAVGASVPTSDSRELWVGPFVRYQGVFQDSKAGSNTNDAKILIVGLSFELGPKAHKKAAPEPVVDPLPAPEPVVDPVPAPKPPVVTTREVEIELVEVVQFAWDSPVLDSAAVKQLNKAVEDITASSGFGVIKVEGHASSDGQVEHNNVLALKRAKSVANFLTSHGVPKDKVTVSGFGSSVPVADNKTLAGRVLNRRAQFTVKFTVTVVKESK